MPLSDVRIIDLTDERGAYCAKLLADMGADVVRVEARGGDPVRQLGPLFHRFYNANKRSLLIEPDHLRALIDAADVVIVTGSPARLVADGFAYDDLAASNPRLIVAAVTPFGLTGPSAEWKSCDTVAQALGGMMFVNGHPDEPPLRSLGLQAYHSASAYAAIGILLALLDRERSGRGQLVDVSLHEAVAATVEHVSGFYRQTGQIEVRRGTLHWSRYFRLAKCRDGWALQCSLGDWTTLIEWVKGEGKAQDLGAPEWEQVEYRKEHCVHLFDVLDEWARDYLVADLVEGAQLRRIPYAAGRLLEAVPDDPQLRARGFFVSLPAHGSAGSDEYPGAPYVFSRTPWRLRRGAPEAGEHSNEVLHAWARPRPTDRGAITRDATATEGPDIGARPDARVLTGVRVLDFTWVVAGPVATRILADHGAEVIKIERRDALDLGGRRGGLMGNLNRGKRSLAVNMSDPRGVELVRQLIPRCDLVVDNFSARVMRNWGLDYDGLRRLKPDIIAISMSGFGHSGPHKDYVSYGPTLQALSGFTLAMHHPGGEPAGWGFSYSDMAGGYSAALAALIALWHRRRTGDGQFIDLSQFEALTALIGPALLDVLVHSTSSMPVGNRSAERPAAPHGVYRCRDADGGGPARDRWCALAVFTDDEWQRLIEVMGQPTWARAGRLATAAARGEHCDELDRRLTEWTRTQTAEDVMQALQSAGVAAGIVANAEDLCVRDPQLQARGYWATVPTPEGDHATVDGVPIHLSRTPGYVARPGPLLGEHGSEVLREILDLEQSAIDRLRSDRVID